MAALRIAYAGTPDFAVPALHALITSDHQLVAVITQPDRPAGRGRKLTPSPVKVAASEAKVPVLQPSDINKEEFLSRLREYTLDLLVVAAFGQLFTTKLLDLPRLGCINIHASLLPRWRGASPIQHAILAGDDRSGITIMQMEKRMDAGNIWLQQECEIRPDDSAQTLHDRMAKMAGGALLKAIDIIASQVATAVPQAHDKATYCTKLRKQDGLINWQESASVIARQVRAYHPWPGAYTQYQGRRLCVIEAIEEQTPTKFRDSIAGTVLQADKNGILVQTSRNALRVTELLPAGGKRVSAVDFANSNHIDGAVLG